jgi:pSer/pThr/pTyr-binding forkhead associated (FHA) protein
VSLRRTSSSQRIPAVDSGDTGARFWLRFAKREIPIQGSETVIGRGEGCDIIINESLVSRRHARVLIENGRPCIEDLGSANGTFVNQQRLHGRAVLFPGDHVFIGTCEIEVVRRIVEERPTLVDIEIEQRPTPSSGVGAYKVKTPQPSTSSEIRSMAPSSDTRATAPNNSATIRPGGEQSTAEVDAFEYLGRLADKMFTMGRVDAARRILSSHLDDLLDGARSGRTISPALVDSAGRYAVKLANETLDGKWVDVAVEIHLIACRPMREETVQQLSALRAKAPLGHDVLIARYYEKLRASMAGHSPAERVLCERVASLLPRPNR